MPARVTGESPARTAFAASELQLQAASRHRQWHAGHRAVALFAAAAGFAGAVTAAAAAFLAAPRWHADRVLLGYDCVHAGACIQEPG